MAMQSVGHLIAGQRVAEQSAGESHTVRNPATDEQIASVALSTPEAADRAVLAAHAAQPAWAATPVGDRVQFLFRYKQVLEAHVDELADLIIAEHGKTRSEAIGSIRRGIDCVEFACGAPALLMGRTLPQIAVSSSFCRAKDEGGVGIDSSVDRVPLGVCVGITPFNFPVMVPMWMWPMSIACGNTFVLKPSEKASVSTLRSIELVQETGLPAGVLNVVTGGPETVNRLITHDLVKAVSFVGSTRAGEYIYKTACAAGKRAQCMCGAKNHSIILPDANREAAIDGLIGSAFGNTGQRCLAGSVVIAVGDSAEWLVPALVEKAKTIKVGPGSEPGVSMGPLVDAASCERVLGCIEAGIKEGAKLILDGRKHTTPNAGCFTGPTIFDHAKPGMSIVDQEIFGPVLTIVRADSLEDAIAVANHSEYGNMSVIFTNSGHAARKFTSTVQAGMLGINVGVPAPMAAFPFSGWKRSFFGDLHANGEDGAHFFTKSRVIVTRWL